VSEALRAWLTSARALPARLAKANAKEQGAPAEPMRRTGLAREGRAARPTMREPVPRLQNRDTILSVSRGRAFAYS
jgi:hypothetical protein